MPPASRNQRVPTRAPTPAPIAPSSLDRPAAINAQKRSRSSRRAIPGRPGDPNLSRNARSDRRLPALATFPPVVLRRPVDSAQYTSIEFGHRCREAGVRPSMGSVGDAYDNAMCESFFATLECELLDRCRFKTQTEARSAVFSLIEGFYNPRRRHSSIGYLSPIDYEHRHQAALADRDAPQPAAVLAAVKDKPFGRPQEAAVLDRHCARQPRQCAGRDGRMAPPGAEPKNPTKPEDNRTT